MKSAFFFTLLLLSVVGCNGPAHPDKNGSEFLSSKGYSTELINRLKNNEPITDKEISSLLKHEHKDVTFLIGRNSNIPIPIQNQISNHSNDYVRSSVAYNIKITTENIEKLFHDPSHTVYCNLARNPTISHDVLIKLRKQRNLNLMWFAMNPNCPPSLVAEIENSNDERAKDYLSRTQNRN
jgi:hypothetical protein